MKHQGKLTRQVDLNIPGGIWDILPLLDTTMLTGNVASKDSLALLYRNKSGFHSRDGSILFKTRKLIGELMIKSFDAG